MSWAFNSSLSDSSIFLLPCFLLPSILILPSSSFLFPFLSVPSLPFPRFFHLLTAGNIPETSSIYQEWLQEAQWAIPCLQLVRGQYNSVTQSTISQLFFNLSHFTGTQSLWGYFMAYLLSSLCSQSSRYTINIIVHTQKIDVKNVQ